MSIEFYCDSCQLNDQKVKLCYCYCLMVDLNLKDFSNFCCFIIAVFKMMLFISAIIDFIYAIITSVILYILLPQSVPI